jgi:hypothetical protein
VEAPLKGTFSRTGVFVLLAAALGGYAWFVEREKPKGDEKKKETLFSFEKAKVKALVLEPAGAEPIRAVHEAGAWKLEKPTAAPADTSAVETVVDALNGLSVEEVVSETPAGLADYGLEKPKATVHVELEGQPKPLTLFVGDKSPDSSGLYAKTDDKPRVFLIASWLGTNFEKKPFDFRDRDLLHLKRDDVRTLEIAGPEGAYTLVKQADGEWGFTTPLVTRAGRWAVDGLLSTLEGLRFDAIVADDAKDLKPFGLAKPSRTVTASLADGSQRKLEIGSETADKKWHAKDALKNTVTAIPPALVDDLKKGMTELRQKRVLDVSTYEVEGFDAVTEKGKQVYARTSSKGDNDVEVRKWKRIAPDTKELDTSKVEELLFKLGGLEATSFVDQPKAAESYGLDKPALTLEFRLAGGKGSGQLEIGKKDGAAFARRSDDAALLQLDPAKLDELTQALAGL